MAEKKNFPAKKRAILIQAAIGHFDWPQEQVQRRLRQLTRGTYIPPTPDFFLRTRKIKERENDQQ